MNDDDENESPPLAVVYVAVVVIGLLVPMLAVAWLNVQGPRECRERPEVLR